MVFLGGAVLADIMKDKESFWCARSSLRMGSARSLSAMYAG